MTQARTPYVPLAVVTLLALAVHGYHLGVDDSAIYIPAIKRVADPALYPFGAQFFLSHAHLSYFSNLVGATARWSPLSSDTAIFLWHLTSLYLLFLAAWRLARLCFDTASAQWGSVALLAALLSVPVAGTALAIMDPYLTARSLSTPATLFAVGSMVSARWRSVVLWLVAIAALHPQMAAYAVVFAACYAISAAREAVPEPAHASVAVLTLPFWDPEPATGPARDALFSRSYFFVSHWAWYEWLGVFAPLALLWCIARYPVRGFTPVARRMARALVPFALAFTAFAVLLASDRHFENFNRLQPMRSLHIVYVLFFILLGGWIGGRILRSTLWRWAALFVPLAGGMFTLAAVAFPDIPHVEIPGVLNGNSWDQAFFWIRGHTPKNAVFALGPTYMLDHGEDYRGFRAVAERSALADDVKDSGAVSLFPQLASEWKAEVSAQAGWSHFRRSDFEELAHRYPVTWIVTELPAPDGLACPYENRSVAVCSLLP